MNDLEVFFYESMGNRSTKWRHYFEIYDRHLARFRGKDVHVVEFGVKHGGSLQMWKYYFGPCAHVYGVDINPNCKQIEEEGIEVFIGDQEDRTFLRSLLRSIPRLDVLIDDGGHSMKQQIATFEELFAHISADGVYICEDLHTSYWPAVGGGYKRHGTFIEYSKEFIDYVNAWHSKSQRLQPNEFTKTAYSLHYYDSVLVVEKRPMAPPERVSNNGPSRVANREPRTLSQKVMKRVHSLTG